MELTKNNWNQYNPSIPYSEEEKNWLSKSSSLSWVEISNSSTDFYGEIKKISFLRKRFIHYGLSKIPVPKSERKPRWQKLTSEQEKWILNNYKKYKGKIMGNDLSDDFFNEFHTRISTTRIRLYANKNNLYSSPRLKPTTSERKFINKYYPNLTTRELLQKLNIKFNTNHSMEWVLGIAKGMGIKKDKAIHKQAIGESKSYPIGSSRVNGNYLYVKVSNQYHGLEKDKNWKMMSLNRITVNNGVLNNNKQVSEVFNQIIKTENLIKELERR